MKNFDDFLVELDNSNALQSIQKEALSETDSNKTYSLEEFNLITEISKYTASFMNGYMRFYHEWLMKQINSD